MTTQALFWPKPERPLSQMATECLEQPVLHPPGVLRSASDSVVTSKGRPGEGVKGASDQDAEHAEPLGHNIQREDVGVQTTAQGTLFVAARALPKSKLALSANKARQQLQLPSFQALGIAVPYPPSILTPPDEPTPLGWAGSDIDTSERTPTFKEMVHTNQQASNTPLSPLPPGSVHESSNDTPTQGTMGSSIPQLVQSSNQTGGNSSNSSAATEMASRTPWLEQALGAALPSIAAGNNVTVLVSVLYHPQPCPLSRAVEEASNTETVTAKNAVINALQTKFERFNATRFVEVTQLVPPKFSFSQMPSSPLTTPNRPAAEANMADYFSMPKTTIYTKGATVLSHAEVRRNGNQHSNINSLPQTVVAPSSITLSVLERYILPATRQEHEDLFEVNQPSALVDRMTELKPDNGVLIFIYPTRTGGKAWKKQHLNPILDPQLHTMNQANGMPMNLVHAIGFFEARKAMYEYELLRLKISELVKNMNAKGNGNLHQFTVAAASKQFVHIGRDALVEWYLEQELPRIRALIDNYYGRTLLRVSQDAPPPDFTSAGFVSQIINSVKTRPYDAASLPRDDIEVGVFVIKRSR
ncbi:MAG: hypothetical protein Q9218_005833 [Villophora microphyllina]